MKNISLTAILSLFIFTSCKDRNYNSGSEMKSRQSAEDKAFEEVACAFFCPGSETPVTKMFKIQRFLCEEGQVTLHGDGMQLTGKIYDSIVSSDLSDIKPPSCMGYKQAIVEVFKDGLWHPDYPALTKNLNKKEIFRGRYKFLLPLSAAITADGEWGILRVNDEAFLIKKVAGIPSPNSVGQYHVAGGYPDKPETSDDIVVNLFRRNGKFVIEGIKMKGL